MSQKFSMTPIAHIHSDFAEKFGVPRQSGLVEELEADIVFEPAYQNPDALRGLEDFSHIWLIWVFDRAIRDTWSPTVRPPRLGGNTRMGVFATRSPFRPNPIALSCVKLAGIRQTAEGPVLRVRGADLVNGTPILDIKPYIPLRRQPSRRIGRLRRRTGRGNPVCFHPPSPVSAGARRATGGFAGRSGSGPPAPLPEGPGAGLRLLLCRF